MAYILAAERDQGEPRASVLWREYQQYLEHNRERFPPGAYALATSDWYFSFSDHRAPHDSWLQAAVFEEPSSGERQENRTLSLRLKLLGAYHDHNLEFFYPRVFAYTLANLLASKGHCDWRYDEFRLSNDGNLVHEIEWAGSAGVAARWLIEASDVEFRAVPRGEV